MLTQSDIYAALHNDRYDEQQGRDVAIYRAEVRRILDEAAATFKGMNVRHDQAAIFWQAIAAIPVYCRETLEAARKELKGWVNA